MDQELFSIPYPMAGEVREVIQSAGVRFSERGLFLREFIVTASPEEIDALRPKVEAIQDRWIKEDAW